jgi:hypothetical protein
VLLQSALNPHTQLAQVCVTAFRPPLLDVPTDAHRRRTGGASRTAAGPTPRHPGDVGRGGGAAAGALGLPGGSSLPRLLAARRGARNPAAPPRLTIGGILASAGAHRGREGRWPSARSGPVLEAPGGTWRRVATALREGLPGLPGGDLLPQLLRRH